MKRILAVLPVLTIAAVVLAQPVLAGGLKCSVTDPEGDAFWFFTSALPAHPYQDIIQVQVREAGKVFTFKMDVAGTVPDTPTFLIDGAKFMTWMWLVDLDPWTMPAGYPLAAGSAKQVEVWMHILWDGESFSAELIDRRPLLDGEEAVVMPISFSIKNATLSVSVDADVLGNPLSFRWRGVAQDWTGAFGSTGQMPIDLLPLVECPLM
jgi:hypothetical protein